MFKFTKLSLVCLALILADSQACRCRQPEHEQLAICNGKNALEFKVTSQSVVYLIDGKMVETNSGAQHAPRYNRYNITNLQIYQAKPGFLSADLSYVYSSADFAACGTLLTVGVTYAAIGGGVYNGNFLVDSCMRIHSLSSLGLFQKLIARLNLRYLYKQTCGSCRISDCKFGDNNCLKDQGKDICKVSSLGYNVQPLQSACVYWGFGRCKWIVSGRFLPSNAVKSTSAPQSSN